MARVRATLMQYEREEAFTHIVLFAGNEATALSFLSATLVSFLLPSTPTSQPGIWGATMLPWVFCFGGIGMMNLFLRPIRRARRHFDEYAPNAGNASVVAARLTGELETATQGSVPAAPLYFVGAGLALAGVGLELGLIATNNALGDSIAGYAIGLGGMAVSMLVVAIVLATHPSTRGSVVLAAITRASLPQ